MTETDHASSPFLTEDAYAPSRRQGIRDFATRVWCGACRSDQCLFPTMLTGTPNSNGWVYGCHCPPCLCARFKSREGPLHDAGMKDWERSVSHAQEQLAIYERRQQEEVHRHNTEQAKQQLGPREFTLTYGNHFPSEDHAKGAMDQAIERLTRYYKDEIIEFHAIGEYTKAGRPHIHGWYHLDGGRKITDKNFKRAYPIWNPKKKLGKGFEGGHHATIERVSDFHGYTEKHLEEAWHITNITNADDNSRTETPNGLLEGLDEEEHQVQARNSGGEEPSSADADGDRDDC
jgi:hypothetical protein